MAFSVSYIAGGMLDELTKIKLLEGGKLNELETLKYIEGVHGFAHFLQPYNIMECIEVAPIINTYEVIINMPDMPAELLGFTVSCTGYGEMDYYDLYINDKQIFYHWYCQEVKEGLFIGSSTYVYRILPNTIIKARFYNASGTRKKLYMGVRALVPSAEQLESI